MKNSAEEREILACLAHAQLCLLEGYLFSCSASIAKASRLMDAVIEAAILAKTAMGEEG